MKKGVHPTYNTDTTVTCVCGNSFTTGSTKKEINTEICSNCHPFYTGKQNLVDSAGRVDKFQAKMAKAKAKAEKVAETKAAKAKRQVKAEKEQAA